MNSIEISAYLWWGKLKSKTQAQHKNKVQYFAVILENTVIGSYLFKKILFCDPYFIVLENILSLNTESFVNQMCAVDNYTIQLIFLLNTTSILPSVATVV